MIKAISYTEEHISVKVLLIELKKVLQKQKKKFVNLCMMHLDLNRVENIWAMVVCQTYAHGKHVESLTEQESNICMIHSEIEYLKS